MLSSEETAVSHAESAAPGVSGYDAGEDDAHFRARAIEGAEYLASDARRYAILPAR